MTLFYSCLIFFGDFSLKIFCLIFTKMRIIILDIEDIKGKDSDDSLNESEI